MSWTTELDDWLDEASSIPTDREVQPQEWIDDLPISATWVRAAGEGWPTDLDWHLSGCQIGDHYLTHCDLVFSMVIEAPIESLAPGSRLCKSCRYWATRSTFRRDYPPSGS